MNKRTKIFSMAGLSALLLTGCAGDYLDTVPTSSVTSQTLFTDSTMAKMAINGMARLMVNQYQNFGQTYCGEGTIKFYYGEYLGENFGRYLYGTSSYSIWSSMDNNETNSTYYPWYYYYTLIGNANEFLANVGNVRGSQKIRDFLRAQALVYRAYSYTQLIPFYCRRWADSNGGTSVTKQQDGLVLRTEENRNVKDVALSSSGAVYTQIYKDLDEAISLFQSSERKRTDIWDPNINVAYAVYARAALTREDYGTAAAMAAKARKGYPLMSNKEYTSGFSSPNGEWIWGSYGDADQTLSYYGFHSYMSYDANTSIARNNPTYISKTLYEQIPSTDIRKQMFLDPGTHSYEKKDGAITDDAFSKQVRADHPTMPNAKQPIIAYHAFKFSIKGSYGIGYINQFRSSEMMLVEAEAQYHLHKEAEARELMNALVRDSGRDPSYECVANGADLLKEIKLYRAIELWGEGFNWQDKKRYNEPFSRASFDEGGNFPTKQAVTYQPDYKNGWTFVTPLKETETNHKM
jgi:hypothetical protein